MRLLQAMQLRLRRLMRDHDNVALLLRLHQLSLPLRALVGKAVGIILKFADLICRRGAFRCQGVSSCDRMASTQGAAGLAAPEMCRMRTTCHALRSRQMVSLPPRPSSARMARIVGTLPEVARWWSSS